VQLEEVRDDTENPKKYTLDSDVTAKGGSDIWWLFLVLIVPAIGWIYFKRKSK